MKIINIKLIVGLIFLLGMTELAHGFVDDERRNGGQTPDLPAACANIHVPSGNRPVLHTYAVGVQIYRWNGASWDFVAPVANLYSDENFYWQLGIHYAGPTWENNRGKVVAARVDGCEPDPTAIPWLLLQKSSTDGHGVFSRVTYIQRVNTAGGLRPSLPGTTVGEEKRVPYTAEYYFYRAGN